VASRQLLNSRKAILLARSISCFRQSVGVQEQAVARGERHPVEREARAAKHS